MSPRRNPSFMEAHPKTSSSTIRLSSFHGFQPSSSKSSSSSAAAAASPVDAAAAKSTSSVAKALLPPAPASSLLHELSCNLLVVLVILLLSFHLWLRMLSQHEEVFHLPADADPRVFCPELPWVPYENGPVFGQHYPRPKEFSRGDCLCTPVHNFVLISMQRSGSGWVETMLNSHPNVLFYGEVFLNRKSSFFNIKKKLNQIFNLDAPLKDLALKRACTQVVGFKWMLNQGPLRLKKEVMEYFKEHHVSVIMLHRRNVLRRLVSILANDAAKEFSVFKNSPHESHPRSIEAASALADDKVYVRTKNLVKVLIQGRRRINLVTKAFNETRRLVLFYEDVIKNQSRMMDVMDFLGLPRTDLKSTYVRIHSKSLNETIDNFDEVARKLSTSSVKEFLLDE